MLPTQWTDPGRLLLASRHGLKLTSEIVIMTNLFLIRKVIVDAIFLALARVSRCVTDWKAKWIGKVGHHFLQNGRLADATGSGHNNWLQHIWLSTGSETHLSMKRSVTEPKQGESTQRWYKSRSQYHRHAHGLGQISNEREMNCLLTKSA